MGMELEMEPRKAEEEAATAAAATEEKAETALEKVKRLWVHRPLPKASARERATEIKEWLADPQKRKEVEENNAAWEIVRRDFSWEFFRDNWACSFASLEENNRFSRSRRNNRWFTMAFGCVWFCCHTRCAGTQACYDI